MEQSEDKLLSEFDPAPKQVVVDTRLGAGFNAQTLETMLMKQL